jgi:L-threonylcarbamoyladenylate synthase
VTVVHTSIAQAAICLQGGGIVGYPTEGVFGLGCDPVNEDAVRRLLKVKGRAPEKGLILISGHLLHLQPYVRVNDWASLVASISQETSPTTWVVSKSAVLPDWISGGRDTVAVRVTRHPVAASLCNAFGRPLVSTSANPAGHTPTTKAEEVCAVFGELIDMVLDLPVGSLSRATPIIHLRTGERFR